jgi:hypothetical protein
MAHGLLAVGTCGDLCVDMLVRPTHNSPRQSARAARPCSTPPGGARQDLTVGYVLQSAAPRPGRVPGFKAYGNVQGEGCFCFIIAVKSFIVYTVYTHRRVHLRICDYFVICVYVALLGVLGAHSIAELCVASRVDVLV